MGLDFGGPVVVSTAELGVIRDNIILNGLRLNASVFKLEDGVVDKYVDESGVDLVNSVNLVYNAAGDYYDGTIASLTLDFFEYATDGAAQAAYVTNGVVDTVDQEFTSSVNNGNNIYGDGGADEKSAQTFIPSGNITCSKVRLYLGRTGSPADNISVRIETTSAGYPTGTLVHANAVKTVAASTVSGAGAVMEFVFPGTFSLSAATTYAIVLQRSGSRDTVNYIWIGANTVGGYANGIACEQTSGSWGPYSAGGDYYFQLYRQSTVLQCYSEATIKEQGSYSLKGIADQTTSLNYKLTRSVSPVIDLSGKDTITLYLYASRTGSNIKIGIHDSGGTTTEITPNITNANAWQKITWDISAVSNANKDAIDQIIITIVNADAANTFYIDDMITPAGINNITLICLAVEAEAQPVSARLVVLMEDIDAAGVNTDIKGWASEDGGLNYDQITLTDEGDYDGTRKILCGEVALTDRSDKTMRYKITTHNTKNIRLHGAGLIWY